MFNCGLNKFALSCLFTVCLKFVRLKLNRPNATETTRIKSSNSVNCFCCGVLCVLRRKYNFSFPIFPRQISQVLFSSVIIVHTRKRNNLAQIFWKRNTHSFLFRIQIHNELFIHFHRQSFDRIFSMRARDLLYWSVVRIGTSAHWTKSARRSQRDKNE